jgi:UDP-N-acetylglucosamine 3-dehydrogenase
VTASPKALGIALLGCGYAARIHTRTLKKEPGVRRYYASRSAGRADEFAHELGGAGAFGSYEAAMEADEVVLCTPPAGHLEQTLAALERGKHVIVEKPPFLRADDFEAVGRAAAAAGCRVFVAENYFYKPLRRRLAGLLAEGVIGDVLFVHVAALKTQKVSDWRGDPALSGGGALFEGGIHWVSFAASLGLEVASVSGRFPAGSEDFDRSVHVSIEYREGAVGSLYHSWETPSLFKGLRLSKIYGREGSITFESNGLFVLVRGRKKRILFPGLLDIAGYRAMFADFLGAIREDREPEYTLALAERDLRLVEAIYASRGKE